MKRLLPIFALLCVISASSPFLSLTSATYNESMAKQFWNFCMGSYCNPSRIAAWDLGFVSDLYPKVTDVTVIMNSTGNACGFTAYNPDTNEVMIVFRGTEPLSIKNWIDDIDIFFTDYPGCEGCSVHEGFYYTYLDIQAGILESAKILFAKYPKARKLLTGHSLGGALAVHASVEIVSNFGPIDEFYTFGAPRVGNQAFANFINSKVQGNFNSRITHYKDPIPQLPLNSWGFVHNDREIFYDQDSSSYKICQPGEDDTCSNAYLDIYVGDHFNYMGQDIILYYLECQF